METVIEVGHVKYFDTRMFEADSQIWQIFFHGQQY